MVFLLALLLPAPAIGQRSSATASALVIRGHGFGHGIGLSQWGAEERAVAGETDRQILGFYYPGTTVTIRAGRIVRVLVADSPQVEIGSRTAFMIDDGAKSRLRVSSGRYQLGASGKLGAAQLTFPIVIQTGVAPLVVGGKRYDGTLRISRAKGGQLLVVDDVELESYVASVVSSEVPASWNNQALRSQAVASRTYALSHLRPAAAFDLYPDDRSQNFNGLSRVFPAATAATKSTTGQVLVYRGKIADAEFSASNGGLTSSLDRAWGGPRSYLPSRRDRFDARSPRANWGPVHVSMAKIHQAFGAVPATVTGVELRRDRSDRVTAVTFLGAGDAKVTVTGLAFQERLGLLSTFFELTPVVSSPTH